MGLPVHACSDEELMHYAQCDADAAAELARRAVAFRGTYLHEIKRLEEEVADLDSQLEDAEGENSTADDMWSAIQRTKELLKDWRHLEHGQLMTAVEEAIDELRDF